MAEPKLITLTTTDAIDFSFHIEGDEIVIDTCKGINPEDGLALFPSWMLEAIKDGKTNR